MPQTPLQDRTVSAYLADVSTASIAYAVAPIDGYIITIRSVMYAAITGSDTTVTPKIGSTAITGGALTLAVSGAAAGDVDESSPTGANYVTAGQAIKFDSDGASSTTCPTMFYATIRP